MNPLHVHGICDSIAVLFGRSASDLLEIIWQRCRWPTIAEDNSDPGPHWHIDCQGECRYICRKNLYRHVKTAELNFGAAIRICARQHACKSSGVALFNKVPTLNVSAVAQNAALHAKPQISRHESNLYLKTPGCRILANTAQTQAHTLRPTVSGVKLDEKRGKERGGELWVSLQCISSCQTIL